MSLTGTRDKEGYDVGNITQNKVIPNFHFTDRKNELISVRDFQENVLLIRFYEDDRESFENAALTFREFARDYYEGSSVRVLHVCIDCDFETWIDAGKDNYTAGLDLIAEGNWNSELKQLFRLRNLPQYVLINKDNKYVNRYNSLSKQLEYQVDSLLHLRNTSDE